jgi:hypothetical protein
VSFTLTAPTRHAATCAARGFVHADVLLALTEPAYAASKQRAGSSKPAGIVCTETRTRAE